MSTATASNKDVRFFFNCFLPYNELLPGEQRHAVPDTSLISHHSFVVYDLNPSAFASSQPITWGGDGARRFGLRGFDVGRSMVVVLMRRPFRGGLHLGTHGGAANQPSDAISLRSGSSWSRGPFHVRGVVDTGTRRGQVPHWMRLP